MGGTDTLDDALSYGQGIERPFRCTEHDDSTASATVNVIKGVWFCHACHASGGVDKKKAPSNDELEALLAPETSARLYPEAFNELFAPPGEYWTSRFSPWIAWKMGLGQDPFTGDATFPVHTGQGKFAGIGRRKTDPQIKARYLYPAGWSAASTMFGSAGRYMPHHVICLVEGAADATAGWEAGCPTWGVYGAGVHLPQYELIARMNPKLILLGFDMDEAGERAVSRAFRDLTRIAPMVRVRWPRKDPGDTPIDDRREALERAVRRGKYGSDVSTGWDRFRTNTQAEYQRFVEEQG